MFIIQLGCYNSGIKFHNTVWFNLLFMITELILFVPASETVIKSDIPYNQNIWRNKILVNRLNSPFSFKLKLEARLLVRSHVL